MTAKCPLCAKPREQKYRPFCSKRCADIDLARWFNGAYVAPGSGEALEDLAGTEDVPEFDPQPHKK